MTTQAIAQRIAAAKAQALQIYGENATPAILRNAAYDAQNGLQWADAHVLYQMAHDNYEMWIGKPFPNSLQERDMRNLQLSADRCLRMVDAM